MRIAVIGDSISTRNNGSSAVTWPRLLETMIEDGGVSGWTVRNYSIPGLRWRTAFERTPGWLIGGEASPLEAVERDGWPDLLVVMMGVNDRQNPNALHDAQEFFARVSCPVLVVAQVFGDDQHGEQGPVVVTPAEWQRMKAVYQALGRETVWINLWKLYRIGMHYDGLHPTDAGKQWIASSIYMWFQSRYPLTPVMRNIGWLFSEGWQSDGIQWVRRPSAAYDGLRRQMVS